MPSIPLSVLDPMAPTLGIETNDPTRGGSNIQPASGVCRLSYFMSRQAITVTQAAIATGATALVKGSTFHSYLCVWKENADHSLTLVAQSADDTTATNLLSVNTPYSAAFTAALALVPFQIYTFAPLIINTGGSPTQPSLITNSTASFLTAQGDTKRRRRFAQATLASPGNVAAGSVGLSSSGVYGFLS